MTWTPEDFAVAISGFRREVAGLFRRMQVTRSDTGVWQTIGHYLLDTTKRETREPEVYPGIGIFGRPPDGGSGEALVVSVGGPNQLAIVATRDEGTRSNVADVGADETALYNSQVRVHAKKNGTIEARTHTGTAVTLARYDEFAALIDILRNWTPVPNDGGAALKTLITSYLSGHPTYPAGTKRFLAE